MNIRMSMGRLRIPTACALAMALLGVVAPASLGATHATATTTARATSKPPSFPIPASERLGNATAKATSTTVTTAHPTTTTPASALPTPSASPTPNPGSATPATPSATPTAPTTTSPTSAAPRTLTPAGAPLTTSARKAHAGPTHLSTAALTLAIVAALIVLASAIWALVRWLAPEPRWTRSLMYSVDEAGFRASSTWAEFTDWVRLGR
jgi:hypothetical protein